MDRSQKARLAGVRHGRKPMRKNLAVLALAAILQNPADAPAQNWPSRPITLVVPYAAGGPVDTIARIVSARMSETLGQQIVIENVPGAGGMSGSARVAKATPDGYMLLLSGSATLAQVPNLYKKPLYNPLTDFEHVVLHSDSARPVPARGCISVPFFSTRRWAPR